MHNLRVYDEGYELVCGIDEVGRGCFAGPVVAAAVIMPMDKIVDGVRDSKKLSEKKRILLDESIRDLAIAIGIGIVEPDIIDRINIKQATRLAMKNALLELKYSDGSKAVPDIVLIDAEEIETDLPQMSIIHGDDSIYQIACASIVAKVYRDSLFEAFEKEFPGYSLQSNKGYGTAAHIEGIKRQGITKLHRISFLKKYLEVIR